MSRADRPVARGGNALPIGAPPSGATGPTERLTGGVGVSVDLWFTLLWFRPGDREAWRAERLRVIAEALGDMRGRPLSGRTAARAVRAEVTRLWSEGSKLSSLDPERLLERLVGRVGGGRRDSLPAWAEHLSEAGLRERPPRVNPEARRFLAELERRGVPVVVLTNSARRPDTWVRLLERLRVGPLRTVVTSSSLGYGKPDPRAFGAAARALGLARNRLTHIGDCWHADVEGARRVSATAVWYRGLFARYPDPGQAAFERSADDGDETVRRVDRLLDGVSSGRHRT